MELQHETHHVLQEQLLLAQEALESSRLHTNTSETRSERRHLLRQIDLLSHLVLMQPAG